MLERAVPGPGHGVHHGDTFSDPYEWMRDNYFGGITYNGNGDGTPPRNDRSFGYWGMPSR